MVPFFILVAMGSVVGQADGIPHLFPFRAAGVGFADNVKLSLTSPMILHLFVEK